MSLRPPPTDVVVDLPLQMIHRIFRGGAFYNLYQVWCIILTTGAVGLEVWGCHTQAEVEEKLKAYCRIKDLGGPMAWKVYAVLHKGKRREIDLDSRRGYIQEEPK